MSEAETVKQFPKSGLEGVYEYTQHSFWGGAWYPYWSLILITILGGFFGLDHLYLRSPSTAVLKFIINLFGYGLWYIYDLIQICGEKETVLKYGLSVPGIGPLGVGAGMFKDNHPGETPSKSPFRFLAYMFLVWLACGLEYLVAGDSNGALAKFISMFLFPIGFIWTILNIFNALFNTKSLFTHGSYRMFPFNWFMDPYGLNKLGPIDQPQPRPPGNCDPGGAKGVFRNIIDKLFYVLNIIRDAIVGLIEKIVKLLGIVITTAINIVLPGVRPAAATVIQATKSVAGAAGAAADVAKAGLEGTASVLEVGGKAATGIIGTAGDLTTQVIEAAEHPAALTTAVASDLSHKIPAGINAASAIPSAVTSQLSSLTTSEGIKAAAKAPLAAAKASEGMIANPLVPLVPPKSLTDAATSVINKQSGGSLDILDAFDGSSMALFLLFVVLLGGGTYYALRRLNTAEVKQPSKKENDRRKGSERNDAPPQS